jgi:hypothetical protein
VFVLVILLSILILISIDLRSGVAGIPPSKARAGEETRHFAAATATVVWMN